MANSKPGIASTYVAINQLGAFTARHRTAILLVVTSLSPTDLPAVIAALDSIQTFVTLFGKIYELWISSE